MLNKDIKYAQKQVDLQSERVKNLHVRVEKKSSNVDAWNVAIKSIKEQKSICVKELNDLKTRYKQELGELHRMERHLKSLRSQSNMLRNQHKSVEE